MGLDARWMIDNIGSTTSPITSSTANSNFQGFYVANSDATGGTARGIYMRLYLTGTSGQSGEAGRFFTTINGTGGVGVHGLHASLSFGTSGTVTGEGAGVRGTLQLPNAATAMGTVAAGLFELSADGASTNPAGTTSLSCLRLISSGNSTGMTNMDTVATIFTIEGFTSGASSAYYDKGSAITGTIVGTLKIKTPAGIRYIPTYASLS